MKTSKIDRLVSVVVIGICLIKAVLYGGSKPPVSTNTPPSDIGGDPAPTNNPPAHLMMGRPRLASPSCVSQPSYMSQLVTNWTARGAWNDWQRVDFPSSFAFPSGTNLITSVTLMSCGEIRENLRCSPSIFTSSLPLPVSLEPGVSTCAYGLTASNSFVFAWNDACVEREATNRVDAAIELFASGDVQVRFGESVTNIVARPPEGFVGEGQDTAWVTNAFPASAADIAEKGYETWLMEDKVGINEQNGLYQVSITVSSLPPDDMPCYLVCGPYKVVVTETGTYSFPLEVFETYKVRTYPVALPLSITTDDGYRGEASLALMMSAPRRMLASPSNDPFEYEIREEPRLVLSPSSIPLSRAAGAIISIWCNITEGARRLYSSLSGWTTVTFRCPSEAEIEESMVADAVEFILETSKGSCSGTVYIEDEADDCCWCCCGPDCRCDGTCCDCTCGCHD